MKDLFKFKKALPVWENECETTVNKTLDFTVNLDAVNNATLYISACTVYSVFVNGAVFAHGPARTAHGFYKVDEIPLNNLCLEKNTLLIRVSGYNVNSFAYIDAPSFLCAEVLSGEKVLFATSEGTTAFEYTERVQKVPRYSYQRAFCEIYNFEAKENLPVTLTATAPKTFLKRGVPYPEYKRLFPKTLYKKGSVVCKKEKTPFINRFTEKKFSEYKLFERNEIEINPAEDYLSFSFGEEKTITANSQTFSLNKNTFTDIDMGKIQTGLFEFEVEFCEKGALYIGFAETEDELLAPIHKGKINIITLKGDKGRYRLTTAEVYVSKYFRFVATSDIKIHDFKIIEFAHPLANISYKYEGDDQDLKLIYNAAVHSFRDNAVDIFMDCPSRERAGWLCDSFFTGRTEFAVTGKNDIEKSFLLNFLLPEKFDDLPVGMLPMCYPADTLRGEFIPTWAMWFGLEVYDYFTRTDDKELVTQARQRLYALLKYFKGFENEYGLLENLDGWTFVEWSKANDLTGGVNFPVNMVYAAFKSVLGLMYTDETLILEARALRKTIKAFSKTDSGFYRDQALRQDGKLVLQNEITEVCQYYAFFFKIADFIEEKDLFETMVNDFGTIRETTDKYPHIYLANAFFGYYLRIELLMLQKLYGKAQADIKDFFTHMAKLTGTLWEHKHGGESCNHGFASYVLCWLKMLDERN